MQGMELGRLRPNMRPLIDQQRTVNETVRALRRLAAPFSSRAIVNGKGFANHEPYSPTVNGKGFATGQAGV